MEGPIGSKLTVQGVGSPVPASVRGEQAGPGASSTSDRSATVVANLATGASNTTSEVSKRQELWGKLLQKADGLYEFSKPKHNVHKEIKAYASSIRSLLEKLTDLDEELGLATITRPPTGTSATQTSPSLDAQQKKSKSGKRKMQESPSPSSLRRKKGALVRQTVTSKTVATPEAPNVESRTDEERENQWKVVPEKKKKAKKAVKETPQGAKPKRPRIRPTRTDALLIKVDEEKSSYADILRRMKSDPSLQNVGTSVKRIRRTGAGDLLLELERSAGEKADDLRSSISGKLGDAAKVTMLREEATVELRDLDELTTRQEICAALEAQLETKVEEAAVKSLRPSYRGTQVAVVCLPTALARRAVTVGKIRIGWVVSHVRMKTTPLRCYRCWDFGHRANSCKGPDRSKLCRKCGKEGHMAKTCEEDPHCMLCSAKSETGHISGGPKCPVYQRALQSATRKQK